MIKTRRFITCIAAVSVLVLFCLGNAGCNRSPSSTSAGTTKEPGSISNRMTSQYPSPGTETTNNIFDNQMYDYGSLYHPRPAGLSYFMDDPDRPKEATAFFMRSAP